MLMRLCGVHFHNSNFKLKLNELLCLYVKFDYQCCIAIRQHNNIVCRNAIQKVNSYLLNLKQLHLYPILESSAAQSTPETQAVWTAGQLYPTFLGVVDVTSTAKIIFGGDW